MRFNDHHIDDLDYIKVLKNNTYAVAYLNENKDTYIDISSCTVSANHKEKKYIIEQTEKICDFKKIISIDKLWLLLLNSNGDIRENLILPHVELVITSFNNILNIDKETRKKLKSVAIKVSKLCLNNLNINNKDLEQLLTSFILIDMINNCGGKKLSSINKIDSCVDYKIQRLLKYLKININIEDIPNFRIEYDLSKINCFDQEGYMTEYKHLSKKEKVKKLI